MLHVKIALIKLLINKKYVTGYLYSGGLLRGFIKIESQTNLLKWRWGVSFLEMSDDFISLPLLVLKF
jgi:hypothetical protein